MTTVPIISGLCAALTLPPGSDLECVDGIGIRAREEVAAAIPIPGEPDGRPGHEVAWFIPEITLGGGKTPWIDEPGDVSALTGGLPIWPMTYTYSPDSSAPFLWGLDGGGWGYGYNSSAECSCSTEGSDGSPPKHPPPPPPTTPIPLPGSLWALLTGASILLRFKLKKGNET